MDEVKLSWSDFYSSINALIGELDGVKFDCIYALNHDSSFMAVTLRNFLHIPVVLIPTDNCLLVAHTLTDSDVLKDAPTNSTYACIINRTKTDAIESTYMPDTMNAVMPWTGTLQ